MKLLMTNFSLRRPWTVLVLMAVVTIAFLFQFPKVHFDNDPENMLAEDEVVRVVHSRVKARYALYDFVIVGIVNEDHPHGIFNTETLGRIHRLTGQLTSLHRSSEGKPAVTTPATDDTAEQTIEPGLLPDSAWKRGLGKVFRHDYEGLFDEEGHSVIINRELISPSLVDNIKQADLGSLKLEYLMESPPETQAEALTIRDDAMGNPLYYGTLVSENGKAIALYIPIAEKTYSYNVANLVRALTETWEGSDEVYITGLPVAEDTFGVEMLVQMATSAPLAGLAIFLLMLVFFRRLTLIIAPMIVAMLSVIMAMGLLIGLGFPVHIMSSMIAIFLMPIAVADSVHILSEFFDTYHLFEDKAKTVRHVIGHLFTPMLYTTLTTMVGFASLMFTPIPPVRVFGAHVAFGVGVAWLLTMTLIPAYIMLAVSTKSLSGIAKASGDGQRHETLLSRTMGRLGVVAFARWKLILLVTLAVLGISIVGVTKININDNPVKWFTTSHPIRVADTVLNKHFGGTYTAYLTFRPTRPDDLNCHEVAALVRTEMRQTFGQTMPAATAEFEASLDVVSQRLGNARSADPEKCFVDLLQTARAIDVRTTSSWNALADHILYLDPDGLTLETLTASIQSVEGVKDADRDALMAKLKASGTNAGDALLDKALDITESFTSPSFAEVLTSLRTEATAALFKRPIMLRYLEDMQKHLAANPIVGKSSSAVDALKKAAYELNYVEPPVDADDASRGFYETRNKANFSVPDSAAACAQVYTQLEGMKKKDSLFHLVTRDYQEANVWIQLKSGDNQDMEQVIKDVERYLEENPAPVGVEVDWAGLTYLNVVWQEKMVNGMMTSLLSSFLVVLIMMMILFRSPLYGLLSMIPLTVTILFIYGLIGWVGKDYDMPVAVLSALTLGLSVDFAIHFLERARETVKKTGNWREACAEMFKEPAMAISRNAITISIGFTPLLVAPLVPYKTVGFFLATIMAMSWLATLFILPALLTLLQKKAFKKES